MKAALVIVISAVLLLGGMKLIDLWIVATRASQLNAAFADPDELKVFHKDIYPYTGGHTQPNFQVHGLLKTGPHGFFENIDLDNPPPKPSGEIRVILTGGSAAAGWGASRQDKLLDRQIEQIFREQHPCGAGVSLRMINLAMGDSVAYQNYIALNRWGTRLAPDIIVSYAGWNDINVPYYSHTDGYRDFENAWLANRLNRYAESPGWLKTIGAVYPGLIKYTNIGFALRSFSAQQVRVDGLNQYRARFPAINSDRDAFDKIAKTQFIHALKSIKRDFQGIPLLVAFQPYTMTENAPTYRQWRAETANDSAAFMARWRMDVGLGIPAYLAQLDALVSYSRAELSGYVNDQWRFVDVNAQYRAEWINRFDQGDGVHPGDDAVSEIARYLGQTLFPMVCQAAT